MAKVSIIVPIYNAEKYLNRSIEALLNQTLRDIEIILVNDGSQDSSLDICKKYSYMDNRIIIVNKNNEGVSVARNIGIDIATSKYIAFMDPDDSIKNDMYEKLYKNTKKYEYDLILCNYTIKDKLGEHVIKLPFNEGEYGRREIIELLLGMIGNNELFGEDIMGSIWRGLYSKKIISKYKIYFPKNIRPMQDLIFNLNYLIKCNSMYINEGAFYYYYTNYNSGINGYKSYLSENNNKVYKMISNILEKNKLTDLAKVRMKNRYINNNILSLICNEVNKNNKKDLYNKLREIKKILNNRKFEIEVSSSNLSIKKRFLLSCIRNNRAIMLYIYYFITKRIIKKAF